MSSDIVMLHVRFSPDGSVVEISERPAPNSAQAWFDWISLNAARRLSGAFGRSWRVPHPSRQARGTAGRDRRKECGGLISPARRLK